MSKEVGRNGSVEAGEGISVGTDYGSPEGDWSPSRLTRRLARGPWRPGNGGARAGSGTWCCG